MTNPHSAEVKEGSFKAGARAVLEMPELKALISSLENSLWHQEKAKSFISHYDDCNSLVDELPEDEACSCGMDAFAHDNHISICVNKDFLKKWRSFIGEER